MLDASTGVGAPGKWAGARAVRRKGPPRGRRAPPRCVGETGREHALARLEALASARTTLAFDDVLLVPRHSAIESRKDIDLTCDLGGGLVLALPVVAAPMDTVCEGKMAAEVARLGGLGIVHRYNPPEVQAAHVRAAVEAGAVHVGAAVGVSGDFMERAERVVDAGGDVIVVDVAHGHHALVAAALRRLREGLGSSVHIMAGNVATREGVDFLADAGADSARVGIGGGSICSTRIQTGHGVPTLQSVLDSAGSASGLPVVADGGIRTSGDVCKALAAGARAIMVGSMLAGTDESPGDVLQSDGADGRKYKIYRGMASIEAQVAWRGHAASVEGVASTVPYKGSVEGILAGIERGLRSGMSYSGCTSLPEFTQEARIVRISSSGMAESRTHINDRNPW